MTAPKTDSRPPDSSFSNRPRPSGERQDKAFRIAVIVAGYLLLALLAAIAIFLVLKAVPALQKNMANFFTYKQWNPDATKTAANGLDDTPNPQFGILALAFGTVFTSLLALIMAVPVAIGVALFIAFYAPRKMASVNRTSGHGGVQGWVTATWLTRLMDLPWLTNEAGGLSQPADLWIGTRISRAIALPAAGTRPGPEAAADQEAAAVPPQ